MTVRSRLHLLQDTVDKTISAIKWAPIPLPAAPLLSPQLEPSFEVETTGSNVDERWSGNRPFQRRGLGAIEGSVGIRAGTESTGGGRCLRGRTGVFRSPTNCGQSFFNRRPPSGPPIGLKKSLPPTPASFLKPLKRDAAAARRKNRSARF
jgi:hypothetical protein